MFMKYLFLLFYFITIVMIKTISETLTEEDDVHSKIVKEGKPPSSPEDGEITDDDDVITKDENSFKVRLG